MADQNIDDFDPEAYLKAKKTESTTKSDSTTKVVADTSDFNPDAYLASKGITNTAKEYTPAANIGRAIDTGVQKFNTGLQNLTNKVPYPLNQTATTLGGIVQDVGTGVANTVKYPLEATFRPGAIGALDVLGNATGTIGNAFGQAVGTAGNVISRLAPNLAASAKATGQALTPQFVKDIAQGYEYLKQNEPETAKNFDDLFNIVSVGTATKLPIKGTPSLAQSIGDLVPSKVANIGTAIEQGGEKAVVKDFAADALTKKQFVNKFSGATEPEKQANAAKIIINNNLTKHLGDPEELMAKAQTLVDEKLTKADANLKSVAENNPDLTVNPYQEFKSKIDPLENVTPGKEDAAINAFNKILKSPTIKKFDTDLSIDQLPELKKALNPNNDLFKRAPEEAEAQANQEMRRRMYLNVVDQVGQYAPETQALNTQAKDLINIINATADATAKMNKKKFNFGQMVRESLYGASGATIATLLASHKPIEAALGAAVGAIGVPAVTTGLPALRKAIYSPANRIGTGKAIKNLGTTLGNISNTQIPGSIPPYSLGALGQQQQ